MAPWSSGSRDRLTERTVLRPPPHSPQVATPQPPHWTKAGRRNGPVLNRRRHVSRAWRHARQGRWYELAGECRRCARCCEAPAIRAHAVIFHIPGARRVFLWWQRQVNGFELQAVDVAQRSFVFRCTHFDSSTRACDSYSSRPGMCRDYPRALLEQPAPEFLPGCGYRARAPRAPRFLRVLDQYPLTEQQREKLRRELHLD